VKPNLVVWLSSDIQFVDLEKFMIDNGFREKELLISGGCTEEDVLH
jgi:hypothetical protein